jgi:hypothetical protein
MSRSGPYIEASLPGAVDAIFLMVSLKENGKDDSFRGFGWNATWVWLVSGFVSD